MANPGGSDSTSPTVGSSLTDLAATRARVSELEGLTLRLVAAIEGYCDRPGCNIPARTTALTKLRWAATEARKSLAL